LELPSATPPPVLALLGLGAICITPMAKADRGRCRLATAFPGDENSCNHNVMPSSSAHDKHPLRGPAPQKAGAGRSAGDGSVYCDRAMLGSKCDARRPLIGSSPPSDALAGRAAVPEPSRHVLIERAEPARQPYLRAASPRQRQLEPSLQAWAASRQKPCMAGILQNVGASERGRTPPLFAATGPPVSQTADRAPPSRMLSGTGSSQFQVGKCDSWSQSLRQPDERGRSSSRGRPWRPRITVPKGPCLRTASRSRSRSEPSSCGRTPDSTPVRRRTASERRPLSERRTLSERHASSERRTLSEPRYGLPFSEQAAIEQHVERMAVARTASASPLRRQLEMTLPAERTPVPPSPVRSQVSESQRPELSIESRLSQLSLPRALSRPHPSSFELEQRRAEEKRAELRTLRVSNERVFREALENPDRGLGVPIRAPRSLLTVPKAPELCTERRAAHSRSTSAHRNNSAGPDWWEGHRHTVPRAATVAAAAAQPSLATSVPLLIPESLQGGAPSGALHLGERARRARAVAEAERDKAAASEWARLCIFKPAGDAVDKDRENLSEHEQSGARARRALQLEERAERARAEAQAWLEGEVTRDSARLCIFKPAGSAREAVPACEQHADIPASGDVKGR